MARNIFLGSLGLCFLFTGLSQISDPSIFGIHGEPERVLYYGGSGLLAGLFGIVALGSGIHLCRTRFEGDSVVLRRVAMSTILLVLVAALTVLVIRFYPS